MVFTTENPGMVIVNPIFILSDSYAVVNASYCDFNNISFQNCPLAYEDYLSKFNFTSCSFKFVCVFIMIFFFFYYYSILYLQVDYRNIFERIDL
jgi:hypothetical protein